MDSTPGVRLYIPRRLIASTCPAAVHYDVHMEWASGYCSRGHRLLLLESSDSLGYDPSLSYDEQ